MVVRKVVLAWLAAWASTRATSRASARAAFSRVVTGARNTTSKVCRVMSSMPNTNSTITTPRPRCGRSGFIIRAMAMGKAASDSWEMAISGRPALRPEMPAA